MKESEGMSEVTVGKFEVGDAVIHPLHGAGIVVGFVELKQSEDDDVRYYKIEMLGRTKTSLMIPLTEGESIGLRPAVQEAELERMLEVLSEAPIELPTNHKKRYRMLLERLEEGDIYQVAEALRDIWWRREERDGLTTHGREIYQKSMKLLSGEIAVVRDIDIQAARSLLEGRLRESPSEN